MLNRNRGFTRMLAGAALLLCSFAIGAAPLIEAGDKIRLYDGPGTTGGGEFWVDVLGTGATGTINASNNDFITFCLEKNETFNSYGQDLKVAAVNTAAVSGGVAGGNPDPLSAATAWLYTSFVDGTLAGYSPTSTLANSLQKAIWYLEEEIAWSELDAQAATWVNAANASGWTDIGNVRVLNLLKWNGSAWVASQDQLYVTPVPEPETYAMLLAGLGLLGFFARRRKGSRWQEKSFSSMS